MTLPIYNTKLIYAHYPFENNEEKWKAIVKGVILTDHTMDDFEIGPTTPIPGLEGRQHFSIHNSQFTLTLKKDRRKSFTVAYRRETLFAGHLRVLASDVEPTPKNDGDEYYQTYAYCGAVEFIQGTTPLDTDVSSIIQEFMREDFGLEINTDYTFEETPRRVSDYGFDTYIRIFQINMVKGHRIYDERPGYFVCYFNKTPRLGFPNVPVFKRHRIRYHNHEHLFVEGKHIERHFFNSEIVRKEHWFKNGQAVLFNLNPKEYYECNFRIYVDMDQRSPNTTISEIVESELLKRYAARKDVHYRLENADQTLSQFNGKAGKVKVKVNPLRTDDPEDQTNVFKLQSQSEIYIDVYLKYSDGVDIAQQKAVVGEDYFAKVAVDHLSGLPTGGNGVSIACQHLYDNHSAVAYLDYNIEPEEIVITPDTDRNQSWEVVVKATKESKLLRNQGKVKLYFETPPKVDLTTSVPSGQMTSLSFTQDQLRSGNGYLVYEAITQYMRDNYRAENQNDYTVTPNIQEDRRYADNVGTQTLRINATSNSYWLTGASNIKLTVVESVDNRFTLNNEIHRLSFAAKDLPRGGTIIMSAVKDWLSNNHQAVESTDYEVTGPGFMYDEGYNTGGTREVQIPIRAISSSKRLKGDGYFTIAITEDTRVAIDGEITTIEMNADDALNMEKVAPRIATYFRTTHQAEPDTDYTIVLNDEGNRVRVLVTAKPESTRLKGSGYIFINKIAVQDTGEDYPVTLPTSEPNIINLGAVDKQRGYGLRFRTSMDWNSENIREHVLERLKDIYYINRSDVTIGAITRYSKGEASQINEYTGVNTALSAVGDWFDIEVSGNSDSITGKTTIRIERTSKENISLRRGSSGERIPAGYNYRFEVLERDRDDIQNELAEFFGNDVGGFRGDYSKLVFEPDINSDPGNTPYLLSKHLPYKGSTAEITVTAMPDNEEHFGVLKVLLVRNWGPEKPATESGSGTGTGTGTESSPPESTPLADTNNPDLPTYSIDTDFSTVDKPNGYHIRLKAADDEGRGNIKGLISSVLKGRYGWTDTDWDYDTIPTTRLTERLTNAGEFTDYHITPRSNGARPRGTLIVRVERTNEVNFDTYYENSNEVGYNFVDNDTRMDDESSLRSTVEAFLSENVGVPEDDFESLEITPSLENLDTNTVLPYRGSSVVVTVKSKPETNYLGSMKLKYTRSDGQPNPDAEAYTVATVADGFVFDNTVLARYSNGGPRPT